MKKIAIGIALASIIGLSGCVRDAQLASHNLSKQSDMFQIDRRIVFYNGINGDYVLTIVGRCSISHGGGQLEVTCKTGASSYKKHFLGLSDNVTYFAEQLEGFNVSVYRYEVVFKPEAIIPDIDLETSLDKTL